MIKSKYFFVAVFIGTTVILRAENLNWFLGASMVKPGKEIVNLYNKENPIHQVNLSIGGSGELLSKIKLSGVGGIYTPASGDFLNLAKKDEVVLKVKPLLVQDQVIALSENAKTGKTTFKDICNGKYNVVAGNPRMMALGETFKKFKSRLPENYKKTFKSSPFGINAVQIVNYIKNGNVDAGYLFKPIALANDLPFIDIPQEYQIPETAYLVILKNTKKLDSVDEFEHFVFKHKNIFKKYGFRVIGE